MNEWSNWGRKLSWVVVLLVVVGVGSWMVRSVLVITHSQAPDFGVYWGAARDLVWGENFYADGKLFTGVGYPPHSLVMFVPLTFVEYEVAQTIWVWTLMGVAIVSVVVVERMAGIAWNSRLGVICLALFLWSFPVKFNLGMGQMNLVVMLVCLVGWWWAKKRPLWGGGLLGVAGVIKLVPVYLGLYFVAKGRWKVLVAGALAGLVVVAIGWRMAGGKLYGYYLEHEFIKLFGTEGKELYYNQGLTGWLARSGLPLELVALGHKVVTVVMVGVTWRLVRIQKKGSELIDWTLVIVMMLVVNNLSWQHHLVWLLLPMMVLVKWVKEEKSWSGLALLGVVYLLVAGNVKNPEVYTGWRRWGLSHGFYGVVLVYGWLAKWKVSSD